jgi:3-dehydroquinate dehydratase-2
MSLLWVLHGVNLDMLGLRDPSLYGHLTLQELEERIRGWGQEAGFTVHCRQTNHEGEFIEQVHGIAREGTDALLVNPGAWTHYSYALRDAVELVAAPVAEVHLSDIEAREPWRRVSVLAGLVDVRVAGRGAEGYRDAIRELAALVTGRQDA